MRKVGFILLGVGVISGLVGAWSALAVAPWAFVGPGPTPPGVTTLTLVICYSPLAVAVVLFVIGFALLLHSPKPEKRPLVVPENRP
jgi:hypothetical protein